MKRILGPACAIFALVCAAMCVMLCAAGIAQTAGAEAATPQAAQSAKKSARPAVEKKEPPIAARARPVASSRFAIEARELTRLARAAKKEAQSEAQNGTDPGRAYERLARFAKLHAKEELGARAALALGYYDYNDGRYTQARAWLDLAKPETLLADYVLFWSAQVDRNLNNNASALAQLQQLRQDYPQSAIMPLALQALAETAISANQPQVALDALASAKNINTNPTLLFLRAQAHEQANDKISAAGDYLEVYDRFPLSTQADEAGAKVTYLQGALGNSFPQPAAPERLLRADTLFNAHQWQQAEDAYTSALPAIDGPDEDLAQLHIADCKAELYADPAPLLSMKFQEPDIDAERLYYLSQAYRWTNDEPNMLAALAQAQQRAPDSIWTERTLFAVGNYYWVNLNRDKAAAEYQQVAEKFPENDDAINAAWRVAWAAYMDRAGNAADLFEKFLAANPDSIYTPDALYWLGRLAQKKRDAPVARAYFRKLEQRFPNNYFALHAAAQLRALHAGRIARLTVLDAIPRLPPARMVLKSTPEEALPFVRRSIALETIAFDDSAISELREAYDETRAASLEFTLARAATNGEEYGSAIAAVRNVYPSIEARGYATMPREAWMLSFPLPYRAQILRAARLTHTDPMILAGLIHQESAFEKAAHSYANAYGLMQLIPDTAQRYAQKLRMGFSEDQLLDPLYNLRVGSVYFGELMRSFHTPEAALAAYNAGEDRVTQWQSGQKYSELPEFVESIPFTQTREYVEIVMRNAAIYRRLYGIW
ncbi:MAG TPA: transglycosylase SLT domain-containing protein [Candidatus Acidoferrales bacterium]|nr:transglycosylase SLT domain-containing protein [Candidatus Acidoferrales bacterium]